MSEYMTESEADGELKRASLRRGLVHHFKSNAHSQYIPGM